MKIEFELNPELSTELETAISECTCEGETKPTPSQYALQALESELAERRFWRAK